MNSHNQNRHKRWLNGTVLGIGLASLFADWSHEIATTVMPAFLATMGVAAAWLGIIEGVSDGLSSFARMASGYYTDKLPRRKPIAVAGYLVTALGTAAFGLATSAWHAVLAPVGMSGNINGSVAARSVQSAFDSGPGAAGFRARFFHSS